MIHFLTKQKNNFLCQFFEDMILFTCLIVIFSTISTIDSRAVMSVDLGTEYMKIAVVKPGVPMEIALNKYVCLKEICQYRSLCMNRESRRKTPVIVAIKGQDREFGEAAISRVIDFSFVVDKNRILSQIIDFSSRIKFQHNPICIFAN